MILSSRIADLLNEAEARFPVHDWTVAGVHAWPLLRMRYGFGLIEGQDPGAAVRASRALNVLRGPARRFLARMQDHTRNASLDAPAEIVLLSDGISYANVGGVWVEKFCDPLIREFEQRHLRCVLLSPLHAYRVPRRTPSHFIQPELDRMTIRALAAALPPGDLEEYASFERWARSHGHPAPTAQWLRQTCLRVHLMAGSFRRILERTGSALGLVVNYYSLIGMAFVLACRKAGLPVADIQHGVGGELHFAYGRWVRVPAGGFNLLPTHFWCWDQDDAAAINTWGAATGHRALVGGNLWLTHWLDTAAPYVKEAKDRVDAIRSRHPDSLHALMTLQFPVESEPTRALLTTLRAASPDVFWWIRLHPGLLAERSRVEAMLGTHEHVELQAATDLALPALLRHMDVHVTHSSSTVLEAAALGVPSVITSAFGAEQYPRQVREGMAIKAGIHDLTEAVRKAARRKGSWPAAPPARSTAAVEELLQAAGIALPVEAVVAR